MDNQKSPNRIHPLMAAAAVSVILASMVGIAAMTGILPSSHGTATPPAATFDSPTAALDNYLAPGKNVNANAEPISAPPAPVATPQTALMAQAAPNTQLPTQQQPPAQQQAPAAQYYEPAPKAPAPHICKTCGRIESVRVIQHQARPSGVGVVAGAVLGGVLGNQVGGGNGRSLATVAGAVGGGYVGNEVEKRHNTTASYQVKVRMEDGRVRHFSYASQPNWQAGDRVRVVNGRLSSAA